jgi:hypothetical protein
MTLYIEDNALLTMLFSSPKGSFMVPLNGHPESYHSCSMNEGDTIAATFSAYDPPNSSSSLNASCT